MSSPEPDKDFQSFMNDLLVGTLGESDEAAFADRLLDDPAWRADYLAHLELHGMLAWELGDVRAQSSVPSEMNRIDGTAPIHPPASRRLYSVAMAVAAAMLIATAAAVIYTLAFHHSPQAEDRTPEAPPIATLIDATGPVIYEDDIANQGGEYAAGEYSIGSGAAQLLLTSRVIVDLEGPTRLHMHSPMHASFRGGTATFECPPLAKGFTVDLPGSARVVDLGTRFRVTDREGHANVEVLEGLVRIDRTDRQPVTLAVGQSARVPLDPTQPIVTTTIVADIGGDWVGPDTLPDGWGYFDATAPYGGKLIPLKSDQLIGNANHQGFGGGHNQSFNLGAVLGGPVASGEFEIFIDGYEGHAAVPGVDLLVHTGGDDAYGHDGADCLVLRYTISEADLVHGNSATIAGGFRELTGGGNSVTVSVYHNDTPLFIANGNEPGADGRPDILATADGSFNLTATVAAGDTIDFIVFNNGRLAGDETAIRGVVSLTPSSIEETGSVDPAQGDTQ